jgi:amidase
VNSADLLEASLRRIARSANVFSAIDTSAARASAHDADRRLAAGERLPLLGVPFAVEDSRHGRATAGVLSAAGAVVVGLTAPAEEHPNTAQRARWSSLDPLVSGTTTAVATGMVGGALAPGAPGAGQVPAGAAGAIGFQPYAPRRGATTGVLARHSEDVALVLDALGLRSDSPQRSAPWRIGVSMRGVGLHCRARPKMRHAVGDVAALLSMHGNVVHDHDDRSSDRVRILLAPHLTATPAELRTLGRVMPSPLRGLCRMVASAEQSLVDEMFSEIDVLVTPGHTGPPERTSLPAGGRTGAVLVRNGVTTPFSPLWRISGYPAVSVLAGWSPEGHALPVQLTAAPHAEGALLDLARLIEEDQQGHREVA